MGELICESDLRSIELESQHGNGQIRSNGLSQISDWRGMVRLFRPNRFPKENDLAPS